MSERMEYNTAGNDEDLPKSADTGLPPDQEMLRKTDLQCNSHLIQLQASTLIKNASLSSMKRKSIDDYLKSLHDLLTQLPIKKCKLAHCQKIFTEIKVPFSMKPQKVKGDIVFSAPKRVEVIGSYYSKTCLKQRTSIDIVLEMPNECMQEKDFLNQRYLRKRAAYLAYVAHYVKSHGDVSSVMFSYFMENHQKPILLIKPAGKLSKHITIKCHICPPQDSLRHDRFHPSKSNVRKSWFNGIETEDTQLYPTPHYNSIVLTDMMLIQQREHVRDALMNDSEEIFTAIKLLKIWVQQRELEQGQGSFSGYLITMVVIYLLNLGKINKSMSSFQVVRNVFQFLATSNWTENGISMAGGDKISEFHKYCDIVFIDPSGRLNLCHELSIPVYMQVRHEARLSLQTLDDQNIPNSFEIVFMSPVPFRRTFDHFLRINKLGALRASCQKSGYADYLPEYNGNALSCIFSSVTSTLKQGLNSRVQLLSCRGCQYGFWEINQDAPSWDSPESSLTYGFLLTSEATRVVDKGPVAGTQETPAFREFWGDKAEMRQFKDGGIFESVVWNCDNKMQRRNLCELVCKHLLNLHFNLHGNSFTYVGSQMENVLLRQGVSYKAKSNGVCSFGEEVNTQLDTSYNELSSLLRSLKDLPLSIGSIFGTSAALRHTETPPCQTANVFAKREMTQYGKRKWIRTTPPYIRPIEILCHLESSGKWPHDVEASRRITASFLMKIAEELETSNKKLTCLPSQSFLDILKDGFVFRVMVTCPQALALTKKLVSGGKSTESMKLEEKMVHLPKITNALRGISQQNEAFGLTCRLAKYWINTHMLSNHITDVITELLCAYLFINSQPYSEPKSSLAAFHRFLWLLSSYDFDTNPIIVNFNNTIQAEDFKAIIDHFKEHRESLPSMYITTSLSPPKSVMISNHISPIIFNRLKMLASVSIRKLEEICRKKIIDFSPIFSSTTSVYDVVISLDPKHVLQNYNGSQFENNPKRKKPSMDADHFMADVGFDPARYYLQDLIGCHSDKALFFHNEDEPNKIGVLWKSQTFADRDFKIGECLSHDMISEGRVRCDVNAIIEDFKILGDGLVKEIELRSERWNI